VILQPPTRYWECPNCTTRAVTQRADVHTEFHHCAGLRGVWAPMIEAGQQRVNVTVLEREDYVGGELGLRTDRDGRPVSGVNVERPDGSNDLAMFAPLATWGGTSPRGGR
jgi:hypothetical protein